jgi:uncharacterized protein YbbK (DUF523 family)
MRSRTPVLVSACLLGCRCRYDGSDNECVELRRTLEQRDEEAVSFCPEEEGGLATPRPPAWIKGSAAKVLDGGGSVVTEAGVEVTEEFARGARGALAHCEERSISRAYLKERSPSCGVANTHVDGELVDGPGVTAEALQRHGVETFGV